MLNASINVVFFAAFVTAFLKTRLRGLWDFTVFSTVCGAPVCSEFDGILRFFPVGGPLCVGTFRFYGFFAVCGAPVSGDFEILLFFYLCVRTLRVYIFSLCVGPLCVWGLWDFVFFPCVWALCWRLWKLKKTPIGNNPRCGDLKWQ